MNEANRFDFYIDETMQGTRLDIVLSFSIPDVSRSFIQKLIEDENIYVDDKICKSKKEKVKLGQKITAFIPEPKLLEVVPQNIPLDIVYEDEHLLVVDKPKGMVVHPAPGNWEGTMVNALMYHCGDRLSKINGIIRPGIVHRIDKDTSGLLMVAKTDIAHNSLSQQLKVHSITRKYVAVVYNSFSVEKGKVDAPIGRDPQNRLRQAVVASGKPAITNYRLLENLGRFSFIEARLETGRTHQIRVHMAYIKHPLLGDSVYGPKQNKLGVEGQVLHAKTLGFEHPISGEYMEFSSDIPIEFSNIVNYLRETK